LQTDANCEWKTTLHTAGSKSDTDCETLGKIMDRYRDDEEPDPPQGRRLRPFAARSEMFVR
jgi:hypothetical protein